MKLHSKRKQTEAWPSAAEFANLCYEQYKQLPKTGKPTDDEWTVLAGIVLWDAANATAKVVALGAGTKCLGSSKLCAGGLVLNDSHAEVLARRAFLRFVYEELKKSRTAAGKDALFVWNGDTLLFELKPHFSLHFVSTETPCGDACIVAQDACEDSPPKKTAKIEDAVIYTGARLIGDEPTDGMEQTVGALRTKPGKGDRTLSMCCSDKLAKWNLLGVQGALLDTLLKEPIYFQTFNFACECNETAVKRAIYERWEGRPFESAKYRPKQPDIRKCSAIYSKTDEHKRPSPNGLIWCAIPESLKPYEVSVFGRRQGANAKKLNSSQTAVKVCKYYLFQEFLEIISGDAKLLKKFELCEEKLPQLTYADAKQLAKTYQDAWQQAKSTYFQQWTTKGAQLKNFAINF